MASGTDEATTVAFGAIAALDVAASAEAPQPIVRFVQDATLGPSATRGCFNLSHRISSESGTSFK